MPAIRLKEGDFGSDVDVMVGMSNLYLPDRAREGLTIAIPFTEIAAVESLADDRSEQVKQAVTLSLKGLAAAGPAGLLNGMRAVGIGKEVIFRVRLRDGRTFVASADARTVANFRGEVMSARTMPDTNAADAVIAKYVSGEVPLEPSSDSVMSPEDKEPPAEAADIEKTEAQGPSRPVFGRRRRAP